MKYQVTFNKPGMTDAARPWCVVNEDRCAGSYATKKQAQRRARSLNGERLKMGCANTSTGLKDTFFDREDALYAANGRCVLWGQIWSEGELVSCWSIHGGEE